jgi:RND family efflux transporter MFP subunit
MMKDDIHLPEVASGAPPRNRELRNRAWAGSAAIVALATVAGTIMQSQNSTAAAPQSTPAPVVAVSTPLQREIAPQIGFLGQFSAIQHVELRAQAGGMLAELHFKDGDIVRKGDLLFVIDPVPYEIKLSQAQAQLETANARLDLASRELERAQTLRNEDAGSEQNVDQRNAEKRAAQAAVDAAKALIRDARFDLDRTRITAPFTGRIGNHQVSVGNLVSGNRAGSGPTTLLTTLVSTDSVYLDFDISEADYMAIVRERAKDKGAVSNKVQISLSDEKTYEREGTLNFIDNALNRSSGTIHARATVANPDGILTPGTFARVRLAVSKPAPTLLVPDASVLNDQANRMVLTVGADSIVKPKVVEIGELRDGLRIIRAGLDPKDKVIIDGIPTAAPGAKVTPKEGVIKVAAGGA